MIFFRIQYFKFFHQYNILEHISSLKSRCSKKKYGENPTFWMWGESLLLPYILRTSDYKLTSKVEGVNDEKN